MSLEDGNKKPFAHPLWALLGPIGSLLITVLVYLLFSAAHGNVFSPLSWSPRSVFIMVALFVICLIASALSISRVTDEKFEKWIRKGIDLEQFKEKRIVDVFSGHYSNVAMVGLFLGVLLYIGRLFADCCAIPVVTAMAVILLALLSLYSLLYSKFVLGIAGRNWNIAGYVVTCLIVLLVDTVAMHIALKSAASIPVIGT